MVLAPDGTIPILAMNAPGNMHDSRVSDFGEIYTKLKYLYEKYGCKSVVDAAFLAKRSTYLVKTNNDITTATRQQIRERTAEISCRQLSEWGMRTLQGSFPRLRDRFCYKEMGKRKQVIHMIILLSNLRAQKVGINQIATVYKTSLDRDLREMFYKFLDTRLDHN